jgi:hypothetical protein
MLRKRWVVLLPFILLTPNIVEPPGSLCFSFFVPLPLGLLNLAELLLQDFEDAELDGDTHQRNGAGEAQLYLHLL